MRQERRGMDALRGPWAGIDLPPGWKIVPPDRPDDGQGVRIAIEPGVGFGTGSHGTTQVCLRAIAALAPRDRPIWRMLDFGSGSGILSIAGAKLGATVDGVEIDSAAIAEAEHHARINGVSDRTRFHASLDGLAGPYDFIVANIWRSVLLDAAPELRARLGPGGRLVLCGLVSTDVPELSVRYGALLQGQRPEVYQQGDWRALVWRSVP